MIMFEYFKSEYDKYSAKTEQLEKEFNRISMLRLLTVAAAVICAAFIRNIILVFILAAAASFFVFLIRKHSSNEKQASLTKSRMEVMKFFLDRESDKWMDSDCTGEEYLLNKRPQDTDLDLFGKKSVFQFICAAVTESGKAKTAERLSCGFDSPEDILRRQDSIKEITSDTAFRDDFLTYLFMNKEKNSSQDISELVTDVKKQPFFIRAAGFLLPPLGIITAVAGMLNFFPVYTLTCAVIVFAAEFSLCCIADAFNQGCLQRLNDTDIILSRYSGLISLLEEHKFRSEELSECSEILRSARAGESIGKLKKISEYAQMRSNMIAFFLLNTFLMWDVHCASAFEKWQRKGKDSVLKWIDITGKAEEIISFSVISSVFSKTVYPEISQTDTPCLEFEDLRHILIPESKAAGNSAEFHPSVIIITGSNMSGKSTFLRSIGTALVLAKAGAPVLAEKFRFSDLSVLTSVRPGDSVTDGISAFYAEILRIKEMMSSGDGKAVVLIDEIFKGTNTADRLVCARETLRKLAGENRIVIVTTHDFELCDETYGDAEVVNKHFSEEYRDDTIIFDYHIRDGRCKTTNAQYLLKMAGII